MPKCTDCKWFKPTYNQWGSCDVAYYFEDYLDINLCDKVMGQRCFDADACPAFINKKRRVNHD